MLKNMKTSIDGSWGDCIDTVKNSQPLDKWYENFPKLPYNVFKLPDYYSFDIEEMRLKIKSVLEEQDTISIVKNETGGRFSRYRGLGFYARANSDSPLEDHFIRRDNNVGRVYPDDLHLKDSLPDLYESDFTEPTAILNEYFKSIFSKFKSPITKASLLDLRSGGWLGSHVDFPYYKGIRLHASIWGSQNAWYEIDGDRFQIPEDGNWYFIDTGKYHSVWNQGPNHRLTLNVNLSVLSDPKILAENLRI
jgi:hypothetical protein